VVKKSSQGYLTSEDKEVIMTYKCNVVDCEEQMVISVRTRCPVTQLPDLIGQTYGKIVTYLSSIGKSPGGVPFVGYFNMDMNDLDVEMGFPICESVPDKDDIKMGIIPKGKYAETLHVGPYDQLKEAYSSLMNWMAEEKHDGTGIAYEYYLNDPSEVDPMTLETRILFQMK